MEEGEGIGQPGLEVEGEIQERGCKQIFPLNGILKPSYPASNGGISAKRWLEMNTGGQRHPKKELGWVRESKNSRKLKVLKGNTEYILHTEFKPRHF